MPSRAAKASWVAKQGRNIQKVFMVLHRALESVEAKEPVAWASTEELIPVVKDTSSLADVTGFTPSAHFGSQKDAPVDLHKHNG
jgi:hypothetical protein